ncbi:solute carrier family 22 member 1-like [Choristoneura fumiferana]|uniref:solute carrier family 22 member 1-like n=1 Tax=Choristoneura fumiferana TaxID=7141 RepID=UPI003D158BA6
MTEKNKVSLDDILAKFSVIGRYHVRTALLIGLINICNNIYYVNYIFVAEEVGYQCKDGYTNDNGTNSSREWKGCGGAERSQCSEWIYDNPNSFVAEFDLACQEWKRTLLGTMHSFGYMLGLLIVGPLSDRCGRKALLVVTAVLGAICGLTRSFITNYWLYISVEFLEALIGDPCSPAYMLGIEIVATEKRVLFVIMTSLGYSFGGILFPLIFWQVPHWRSFLRVVYGPGLLFIFYLFFIDESPRWLLIKGRKDAAVSILESAANTNKIKLDAEELDNIYYEEEKGASFGKVLVDTFKSKTMLKRFFVCSVWWIASTFVNHGLTINSVALQGNKYINYALTSIIDVPGHVIVTLILLKFKRKVPLVITFVACAVLCVCQPYVSGDLPWLSITVYMAGKLMSSFFFTITYIFTSELFPTYTRNSMHALCSSVGRIGSILAPQTPLLLAYWSGLPATVFGLVSLTAGLLTLLVPDTADNSLPDTVFQAEILEQPLEIGKNQLGNRKESSKL